ncbi:MAG: DUF5674 family protein [Elusimicrobiota bacterium]|jgi:hypothetical protein|nr:DUF5674 family protein [Elusimicrobiota bacterium]
MKIIKDKIKLDTIFETAEKMFGDMVKAVVDIEKKDLAIDAAMHSDLEKLLLENGSEQKNLWGINLYPAFFETKNFIEFDSMINIRPFQGNRSRSVENIDIQNKIIKLVNEKVKK